MHERIVATIALLGALASPTTGHAATPRYDPGRANPQRDALALLEHGHGYLEGVELPGDDVTRPETFEEIDTPLVRFLRYPHLQPAVQFGCAVKLTPGEDRLVEAMESEDDDLALLALAVLMRVHSPSSVDEQLATLVRLKKRRPQWNKTLEVMAARFDKKVIVKAIAADPPAGEHYGHVESHEWAIRAVGVTKQKRALPRLASLCVSEHLHTSLAAERSIEDFTGPKAEAALATCVEGWQYNAAERALDALADRNPELARRTLLGMESPTEKLHRYANALIEVAAPSVVPRLVEIIPELDYPEPAIRAVEDHARPRHRAAVLSLVDRVGEVYSERLHELAARLGSPRPLL